MANPFDDTRLDVVDGPNGEFSVVSGFPIRSEDGAVFLIDAAYAEAFRVAFEFLSEGNGRYALTIHANRSNKTDSGGAPAFIPTSPVERKDGVHRFPLGRIIWDAGPYQQVERKSRVGAKASDWTVSNTEVSGGREDNRQTRADFLGYLGTKIAEMGKPGADRAIREVEKQLDIADALHRPADVGATSVFVTPDDKKKD